MPPRFSACLVKKLNVIGIIGYVHGIASANRPPPTHARINAHHEPPNGLSSSWGLGGAVAAAPPFAGPVAGGVAAAPLRSGRGSPASTTSSASKATSAGSRHPVSLQIW